MGDLLLWIKERKKVGTLRAANFFLWDLSGGFQMPNEVKGNSYNKMHHPL